MPSLFRDMEIYREYRKMAKETIEQYFNVLPREDRHQLLLHDAENGDAEAMFILGSLYENGCWNPNDDFSKALAAKKDIKEKMAVSVDYNEALRWYNKAGAYGWGAIEAEAEKAAYRLWQKMEQQCSLVTENNRTIRQESVKKEVKQQCVSITENNRTIGQESVKKEVKPQSPALTELNRMIGLESVKEEVNKIIATLNFNKMRKEKGLPGMVMSRHMVFTGNAGTGKTSVARILGQIFKEYGILSKGHFIETSREDLIGRYIGETAPKTKKKVEEALGGVLFIDEAYSLVPKDDSRDFGSEAISTLIKMMEDHRDDLIVIVAGYREEMQRFIDSNQGLKSRFSKYIDFPDYSPEEMQQIFDRQAKEGQYVVSAKARDALLETWRLASQYRDFGNGRGVRNIYEKVIQNLAARLVTVRNPGTDDLMNILADDVPNREDMEAFLSNLKK